MIDYEGIIRENELRKKALFSPYDPVTGEGSPLPRVKLKYSAGPVWYCYYIPVQMYEDNKILYDNLNRIGTVEKLLEYINEEPSEKNVNDFIIELVKTRFKYDFEFWAVNCAKILDKEAKRIVSFKLRNAQRMLLKEIEEMRTSGTPIRAVVTKARQWGASTLIQLYMAWIQLNLKTNWNSVIVADVEDQARNIRGMYSRLGKEYPNEFGPVNFKPYEGSAKVKIIENRGCIINIGSVQKPDTLRSFDFAMAHLSECGSWRSTPQLSVEEYVQSLRASILDIPDTLIILESTAKGIRNFFHREWLAAKNKINNYKAIFVPWFKVELYFKEMKPSEYYPMIDFVFSDSYASKLWGLGATLEGIKWYFDTKRGGNYDDWHMHSEFPSTDEEAFGFSENRVFAPSYVEAARKNCCDPELIGEIYGASSKGPDALKELRIEPFANGNLYVWQMPDDTVNVTYRYVVVVDIGGRTNRADWSVIRVFDRYWVTQGGVPEIVATWRGHMDQDIVAWKSAQMAKFYRDALLVIESNSLDIDMEGDHSLTILNEIVKYYKNIYTRTDPQKVKQGMPAKYGFHTNRATKPMVIDELNGALREQAYIERDTRACDEMDEYEIKKDGSYGATEGCHDDLVIATAVGVWICNKYLPPPRITEYLIKNKTYYRKISEAML